MKKRYWLCVIRPTDQDKLPSGSDFPMRVAVQDVFRALTGGHEADDCWSGWGVTEAGKDALLEVDTLRGENHLAKEELDSEHTR